MLTKLDVKHSVISNWILLFFLFILLASGSISEFFQAPAFKNDVQGKYKILFDNRKLSRVDKISFKNPLGTFHLKKISNTHSPWRLSFPRELTASSDTIDHIFEILKSVKIRKIYQQDIINMANFSLSNPLIEMELFYNDGNKHKLLFGLINPIDNSTYITKSGTDVIYHVDALKGSLETLDFANFIDSKIMALNQEEIISLKIYRGPLKRGRPQLSMKKKEDQWYGSNGKKLNSQKAVNYIKSLTELKSSFILDKISEKAQVKIKNHLSTPLYSMEITDQNNNVITYKISAIINSLPGIKIERRQNFIIEASHRNHPFLFNKEDLSHFSKTQRSLTKPSVKKLFY